MSAYRNFSNAMRTSSGRRSRTGLIDDRDPPSFGGKSKPMTQAEKDEIINYRPNLSPEHEAKLLEIMLEKLKYRK